MCIGNADLYGLAHLVQSYGEHVSVASVLDCVSKWDLRNVSTMKVRYNFFWFNAIQHTYYLRDAATHILFEGCSNTHII